MIGADSSPCYPAALHRKQSERRSGVATRTVKRQGGIGFCCALLLLGCEQSPRSAELSNTDEPIYLSDLEQAKTEAKRLGRRVLLYTGRAQFCAANDPRTHLFRSMLPAIPSLESALSRFVICERFIYPDIFTPGGGVNDGFRKEMEGGGFYALHEKYDLRFFQPLITVVDVDGSKIAGPFGTPYHNFDEAKAFFSAASPK